jgi:BA14K-like protein
MKNVVSATLASLLIATSVVPSTVSAAPRNMHRDRDAYVSNYCAHHPGDRDCRDWNRHRNSWDDAHYNRWYRSHRHEFGPQDAAAALFGFVAGAATGALTGAASSSHVAACEAHYRSYDRRTDQFFGNDGQYHYCRL